MAADLATVVIASCALVVTGFAARQHLARPSGPGAIEDRKVKNWDEYTNAGSRIGPIDARVVIVEFGDYECPFCKRVEPVLRQVFTEFPREVAILYRHLPLSYHENAYQAARLAECSADQGRFQQAHARLYDLDKLSGIDAAEFAAHVGVKESDSFIECANSADKDPEIERDLAAANKLGITSTPTLIVNGLQLGRTPDYARLTELVRAALTSK
jgi:protein-disulfide isomerase